MRETQKPEQVVPVEQARRELALRQMKEVLAKYPNIAVELGRDNG